ncbi:16551_t:CDS:1, partial [Acaulospora morrowiae]
GKTTLLLGLKETLKGEGLNYVHFAMSRMQGDILLNKRQGFFNFMSYALFNERLAQYMNETHFNLKDEINRMSDDERRHIRKLTDYRTDCWKMDLSYLTALNDLDKKLFNIGILFRADANLVCFTSCIILLVCIEALFPTTRESLPKHVLKDPIELLIFGLKFIDPSTIIDERVRNQGPSERTLQAALFRVLNGLLPYPMMCLFEVNASGRTHLDLMIVDNDEILATYSLKCNKISEADFRDPLKQAKIYADDFGTDICLVNFILKGHRKPCTLYGVPEEIILVNVIFNAEFTQFEIQTESLDGYQTVNVTGDSNHRENHARITK